jgi:IS5 family transposase
LLQETQPDQSQLNLYFPVLQQILNPKHELVKLSSVINWHELEMTISKKYNNDMGRPAKPIRLMSSLLILKYLYDLSDEGLIEQWIQNPYYQYFGGYSEFQWKQPCASSELVHFRYRIGPEGEEMILRESIRIHDHLENKSGKKKQRKVRKEKRVFSDTTVQEKDITFPTDSKLYKKIVESCRKIAKENGLKVRQSYKRTVPKLLQAQRFRHHPKNKSKAIRAERKLKTIAGRMLREVDRQLVGIARLMHQSFIDIAHQVLAQKKKDSNKILSLHEPHVYCISKGKEWRKYEYGSKVNVMWGWKSGLVMGVHNCEKNIHDSKTIEPTLEQFERVNEYLPEECVTDKGFRGKTEVKGVKVSIPKSGSKKATQYQKRKAREKFRKRAGIEPIISHLKSDFRLKRNFLSGVDGDRHNLMMSAAAFNIRRWIRRYREILKNWLQYIWAKYCVSINQYRVA